jgi:hypothetical protein
VSAKQLSAGALAVLVAALAVATAGAAGGPGREKIRLNAADQAAARAAVIRRADLGAGGWQGGSTKPDLSPSATCANYHPKQSDLVLTGAAETRWARGELDLNSEAQVLRTARMVKLDWQRSVQTPGFVPCLRSKFAKALGARVKLVSFNRIAFPHIGQYAAAFRLLADAKSGGRTVRVMLEPILFGRSRTEITLIVTATAASTASASAAAVRLARTLLARVRA